MNYNKIPGKPGGTGKPDKISIMHRYCLLFYAGAVVSVFLLTAFAVASSIFFDGLEADVIKLILTIFMVMIFVTSLTYIILNERRGGSQGYRENELNMLKSNFITLASHEFRTPLSSVLLSATLIEKYAEKQDTENMVKHTRKIKQVVHRLEGILEDFLSLEKLDAGQVTSKAGNFNLETLCRFLIEEVRLSGAQGQHFSYQVSGDAAIVRLDEGLLRNALTNLLSNTVKYAGEGANIQLSATVADQRLTISVKDDGAGIAEKDQERLFTMFYRVNDSGNIPGTGLGLYLVKRYVLLMGGTLNFYSRPGQETCFKMMFPIESYATPGNHTYRLDNT